MVTLQRLKLLAIVLVLSNFFLGLFSVYLIRRVDRDYSVLIDESVPVLHQLRAAGRENGRAFRGVIKALVTSDAAKCAAAIDEAKDSLRRGERLRSQVLASDALLREPALAREYAESGEACDRTVRDIVQRVTPEDTADAEKDRVERMIVAFDRQSAAGEKLTARVADQAEKDSGRYTADVRSRSVVVLGLAGWPLLVFAAIVVLTVAVVIVMLFVFRQADAGDGP